jgi:hypothetical protein
MQVSFTGKTMNNVLRVPISAYTQDANIWLLGNDDRLQKISPKLVAQSANHVFFNQSEVNARNVRVALYPQTNFTLGQKVDAKVVKDGMMNDEQILSLGTR